MAKKEYSIEINVTFTVTKSLDLIKLLVNVHQVIGQFITGILNVSDGIIIKYINNSVHDCTDYNEEVLEDEQFIKIDD